MESINGQKNTPYPPLSSLQEGISPLKSKKKLLFPDPVAQKKKIRSTWNEHTTRPESPLNNPSFIASSSALAEGKEPTFFDSVNKNLFAEMVKEDLTGFKMPEITTIPKSEEDPFTKRLSFSDRLKTLPPRSSEGPQVSDIPPPPSLQELSLPEAVILPKVTEEELREFDQAMEEKATLAIKEIKLINFSRGYHLPEKTYPSNEAIAPLVDIVITMNRLFHKENARFEYESHQELKKAYEKHLKKVANQLEKAILEHALESRKQELSQLEEKAKNITSLSKTEQGDLTRDLAIARGSIKSFENPFNTSLSFSSRSYYRVPWLELRDILNLSRKEFSSTRMPTGDEQIFWNIITKFDKQFRNTWEDIAKDVALGTI